MAWRVDLTPHAARDLGQLDAPIARRVVAKLEQAATDPKRHFKRLVGYDLYKLRVGDYRVLAHISQDARKILIQRIEHRSRVYDR
ncbi:MAG TPA: type II toxin-antitoxin system RelE/ParE family toxin [Candidatus Thermoplasmatota archaeon]|jgi:mRNA interferase RelE/StbE|nr:type II toxin-antitoxin system RelE/ParE family toxin [Candidatus Thermoplasmatota archaeon]